MIHDSVVRDRWKLLRSECEECISRRDDAGMIRALLRTAESYYIPCVDDLIPWCRRTLGSRTTERLVKALALWRCPACQHGAEACLVCDGMGYTEFDAVCEDCAGFGQVPCELCGGSGLSTLESIPSGLRPAVLYARLSILRRRLDKMTNGDVASSVRDRRADILELNRLVGIVEACIEELAPIKSVNVTRNKLRPASLLSLCAEAGLKLQRAMARALKAMAHDELVLSSSRHSRPAQRAAYYRDLAESPSVLSQTPLRHPLLGRLLERASNAARPDNDRSPHGRFGPGHGPRLAA